MTALERKQNTEKLLETLGIRLRDELPSMEEEEQVTARNAQEIAQRILILSYLNCVATDTSLQETVISFLKQKSLWQHVTENEKQWFHQTQLTDEEITTIQWRGESIWALLWTINRVGHLDLPATEVDMNDLFERIPAFMGDTSAFIKEATIRPLSEILDQSDLLFRLNWAMRQAQLDGSEEPPLNSAIAYERYFALNWVTFMRPQWEEI